MPIEQDLLPSEEFHRAVMEAAQNFYDKTGVRSIQIALKWASTMDNCDTVTGIDVRMES